MHVLGEIELEDLLQSCLQSRIFHRDKDFDTLCQVPGHQVGGADQVVGPPGITPKPIDPGVFEEST